MSRLAILMVPLAAAACTLTTLDHVDCRTDDDCMLAIGPDHLCSADGLCRDLSGGPGECDGELQVRILAARTGPLGPVGEPYFKGEHDLLRETNEQGGIRGCPITFEYVDYAYDTTIARQAYDQWRSEPTWGDVVTLFGFGTNDTLDLSPELADQEIVVISASYSGDVASPAPVDLDIEVAGVSSNFEPIVESVPKVSPGYPYNFFAGTDYSTGGRVAMEFAVKEGAAKVALFACSNAYCQSPLAAIKTFLADGLGPELGRDLVVELDADRDEIEAAVRQFFAEELAQRDADPGYVVPDWVWVGNTTTTAAHIGRAIGLVREETGLDIRVIANNWGFEESLFEACEGGCVDYFHGIMPFAAYGSNVPGMAELQAIHDKWREIDATAAEPETDDAGAPRSHRNVRYVQGYVSVLLWRKAMERLVDYHKSLDGPSLKRVLESFESENMLGLVPPLSFTPTDHRPQATEKIYRVGPSGELVNVPPDASVFLRDEWLGW
jgi:ABC-type branched-subunit amino acid transport system substrate-binding protein